MDLTKEEKNWIRRAKRVMSDKPKDLLLYNVDSGITVCKKGIPCYEFSEDIERTLMATNMLSDLHDDIVNKN